MPVFHDQLNRAVTIAGTPQRIISLVPSITELLFRLGMGERVTGITKFCVHPEQWFRNKTRVGGTKNPNCDQVRELQPDLILANKEENREADIRELEKDMPVWISDVNTVDDALQMIRSIGSITGAVAEAEAICAQFVQEKNDWLTWKSGQAIPSLRTLYLIWREPYMTVGRDTFIHAMLELEGSVPVLPQATRYPVLTTAEIIALQPERVLLSSEPYPFKEQHRVEMQSLLPNARIELVDGEMFSWYGSRMVLAPGYFRKRWEGWEGL